LATVASPDQPVISVVIPTFNRVEMLRRCVDSVLVERRVPIEVHIFDNASTDGTAEWVASLMAEEPRVHYVRQAENIGVLANYAAATASVKSDLFVPLADDDWLLPDFLFDAYGLLQEHPEAAAAAFVGEHQGPHGRGYYPEKPDQAQQGFLTPSTHMRDFLTHGHYLWSAVVWRRTTLELTDLWHTGRTADVDFQAQVFARCPVVVKNQVAGVIKSHGANNSSSFEPSDAVAWDQVFTRLDHAVQTEGLFTLEEYVPLRDAFVRRYRGMLARGVDHELSDGQLLTAAEVSGLTLGDWDSARAYLSRIQESALEVWRFQYVPGIADPKPLLIPCEGTKPPIAHVRWMTKVPGQLVDLHTHVQRQNAHIVSIEARVHELQDALDTRTQRLTVTRAKLQQSRRELRQIRESRAWRFARRLARVAQRLQPGRT
jgi:glycosyltransferase involved in cell wall biosynthesis